MSTSIETFTESLMQLRRALAGADPFAAAEAEDFTRSAEDIASAFAAAATEDRLRFLLRALDNAIAGLEVAARLADDLYARDAEGLPATPDAEIDALRYAYNRFAESQPAYQALYHLRNAVAERFHLESRPIPPAVAPSNSPDAPASEPHDARPAPRAKKSRTRPTGA